MSNIAVLTRAHSVVAAKKRAKREQVKEVLFDDDARRRLLCSLFSVAALTTHLQGIFDRLPQAKTRQS